MGEQQRLQEAVRWLAANVTFDLDARVHVFELTIRAVGGMLSAHMLIEQVRRGVSSRPVVAGCCSWQAAAARHRSCFA